MADPTLSQTTDRARADYMRFCSATHESVRELQKASAEAVTPPGNIMQMKLGFRQIPRPVAFSRQEKALSDFHNIWHTCY